ncbi:MAG: type IV secretion system DNA-binding domain-containing protein [Candidatus Moranbacteria bacterium]|nr:type IV secretion system DNA-binding domain-containing protein [Candidatus Moranbacteria bacterium]
MSDQQEISFFAKTNFRNQDRIFGIKTDDRRRHMYVIGKTGMGKTNLLENLAIQDIKHGMGVAFIDPHGDTAEKLIKAIPAERINDVIYFNPADQDFPIAFNVMESVDPEYKHLVASGLVGVFKKLWADSWGPRLEYILRNAILALLEYPGSTLLGVTRILVDKDYRDRVVAKVTDPVVRAFWVDEFSKWNDRVLQEVISPIQNKVGQFLSTSLIRNIVGQTVSSFNVRDIMDGRKILVMNLSKGRVGEDASALIGAMMITKIQLAAMERVDMPEEDRADFYLYVDEFQNFATESFANILSEARKYHLNLILANQYITQLDEKVADAIFGNAGTIISFRVGAADAEVLEKEFEPVFMMNDIVNLPKYNVYLKLMIDGIAGDAFSATVLPPISLSGTSENEEKVIRVSRERYASSKKEVEDKIRRWSGMLTEEERAELLRKKNMASDSSFVPVAASAPPAPRNNPVPYAAPRAPQTPARRPDIVTAARVRNEESRPLNDPNAARAPQTAMRRPDTVIAPQSRRETSSVTESTPLSTIRPISSGDIGTDPVSAIGGQAAVAETKQAIIPETDSPVSEAAVSASVISESENPPIPGISESTDTASPMDRQVTTIVPDEDEELLFAAAARSEQTAKEAAIKKAFEDRQTFPAICDTCGTEIRVPFEPDGKRPTYCKDCLKDYQRAKMRSDEMRGGPQPQKPRYDANNDRPKASRNDSFSRDRQQSLSRTAPQPRAVMPSEAPISLSRAALVSPKKFQSVKNRPAPDLASVRGIIGNARNE